MKYLKKLFFTYALLILLGLIFELIFSRVSFETLSNLIENILFSLVLISPLIIINNSRTNLFYFIVSYLLFAFSICFETAYFYLFETYFSPSAIFVALDSNSSEGFEFLRFYGDINIVFFIVIILLVVWFSIRAVIRLTTNHLLSVKLNKFALLSLVFGILLFLKYSKLIVYNFPYLLLKSGIEYYEESKKIGNYKENKYGKFKNVFRDSNKAEDEVYVVIVGESTSRSHLALYDYYRETTPELNKRKESLLIYEDVISPHAYSVGAMVKILTMANYENPEKAFDGSIIQLINCAGFETFWLSNQRPVGAYESLITKIALSSKHHKFLTTSVAGKSKVLDEELLWELDEVIKNGYKKKVIFLHLMGTHHSYENRYPNTFKKFVDVPMTNFISDESVSKINHYDNAVMYNDYIISEVLNKIEALNVKSFVLYFSDHGEEMFDDLNMAGHNEDVYSQKMFEIPFLLWQSQSYKKDSLVFVDENRKYMIDDLFHSLAGLIGIKANEVDSLRSIFNKKFKERKRIIKDTVDFDTFFDKNKNKRSN